MTNKKAKLQKGSKLKVLAKNDVGDKISVDFDDFMQADKWLKDNGFVMIACSGKLGKPKQ
ncbi:hypothetical protein MKY96_33420 [Paenibacillus sp. FSL R7-0302]|uniref:hypothetical protein n=1 Tax=Paenibacillus sp. FSL R7-0302 TaxID=2921681 RepID=UPI0030FAEEA2